MAKIPEKHVEVPRHVQRIGDDPKALGPIERVFRSAPDRDESKEDRRRQRHSRKKLSTAMLRQWITVLLVLGGLTLAGLLAVTLTRQYRAAEKRLALAKERNAHAADSRDTVRVPSKDELMDLTEEFLRTDELEVIKNRSYSDTFSPQEILERVRQIRNTEGELSMLKALGPSNAYVLPIQNVFALFGSAHPYLLCLVPDKDSQWKIDYDAMIRYSNPDFEAFVDGSAKEGVLRILATYDAYFNGPFLSEHEWRCFRLTTAETESETLFAYCPVDSPADRAIQVVAANYLRRANISTDDPEATLSPMRLTMRIFKPEGALNNQVQIEELLSDEWVLGPESVQQMILEGDLPAQQVPAKEPESTPEQADPEGNTRTFPNQ